MMRPGRTIAASLEHLVFYPERTMAKYPTIVALHGRGADASDLLPLVESIGLTNLLVIAPRAPLRLNLGLVQGYAWYDLFKEGIPHPETFRTSLELLRRFLVEIRRGYPVNPQQLVLAGFSQGTVMAYAAGLTETPPVRALVGLSGYIHKSALPVELDNLHSLSIFISHGTFDKIIPVELGRETAELLRRAGANVAYREYPMGHEVREETVRDLADWMRQFLSGS